MPAGRNRSRETGPGHPGLTDRVCASASRTCRAQEAGFLDPGGTLGRCRPDWKGKTYSPGASSGMGQTCRRRVDQRGRPWRRSDFRRVNRLGKVWGEGITPKAIWHIVKAAAVNAGIENLAPHDLRRTCARLCHLAGGELEQIQFLPGHGSVQTTERYLGCEQLRHAVNDAIGLEDA